MTHCHADNLVKAALGPQFCAVLLHEKPRCLIRKYRLLEGELPIHFKPGNYTDIARAATWEEALRRAGVNHD